MKVFFTSVSWKRSTHHVNRLKGFEDLLANYLCNVRQSALQKFLKISIKNSKCATSNKHIQDGRPGRYENRRGSKKRQNTPRGCHPTTQEQECPRCHHPEGVRIRNSAIWQQKDRVLAEKCQMRPLCPEDEEWCQRQEADDRHRTVTVYFIGAYPHLLWLFVAYLDNVWPTRASF